MSYQTSQILGWCFFSCRKGTIAVVLCQSDKTKRYSYKAYIAIVTGASVGIDALYVANCGAKFPVNEAVSLIQVKGQINYPAFHDRTLLAETFINDPTNEKKKYREDTGGSDN